MTSGPSFNDLERDGWQQAADHYDDIDLPATSQAFDPLLDVLGGIHGKRLLEVASGTGHLAARALARGALVTGVDISTRMNELARGRAPGATFVEGSAEALPLPDGAFDAAICSFGILHVEQPRRVFAECCRVLVPGGRFAFSVWLPPHEGGDFLGLLLDIIKRYADLDVGLPPAPDQFEFARPAAAEAALREVGFETVHYQPLDIAWPVPSRDAFVEFLLRGSVRMKMLFDRQAADVQATILAALRSAADMRVAAGDIRSAARIVTALKG